MLKNLFSASNSNCIKLNSDKKQNKAKWPNYMSYIRCFEKRYKVKSNKNLLGPIGEILSFGKIFIF